MSAVATESTRILVADDAPAVREVYQQVLGRRRRPPAESASRLYDVESQLFPQEPAAGEEHSLDVDCYAQAENAVEAARRARIEGRPFSVAFIDVRMPPGPDGVWAAEQIRAFDPDIEIVIATAYTDVAPDDIATRVPPAEQLFYIQKPIQPEVMRRLTRTLAAKWWANKRARQAQADLEASNEELRREIGEREEAERALRQSEAVLSSVLRAVPSGVGVVRNRIVNWANERLEQMTGYDKAELIGHNTRFLYESDGEYDQVGAAYRALSGDGCVAIETRWRRKDGTLIDILLNASYLHPADPSAGVAWTVTDISDRKQAEGRQKAITEGLHAVVEAADELIACPDLDSLYRSAVQLARAKLGLERCSLFLVDGDQMQGTYGTDLQGDTTDERAYRGPRADCCSPVPPPRSGGRRWCALNGPHQEWDGERYREAQEGWTVVTSVQHASGAVGLFFNDAAITDAPIDDTKQDILAIYCSVLASIAERKQAEQALRESEERFRALIENASDVVITVDESGTITFASPSATRVLGYDPGETVGRSAFDFVHSDDQAIAREAFDRVLHDGDTRQLVEFRVRAKDGSWRYTQAVASVPGADAPIEGIIINYRDVTEQRQLAEHLQQTSKLQSIGTLAGGVAHDFNNILTGIIGYSDMLKTEGAVMGDHVRDLDKIRHLADRAAGLTRQLLLFSRQQPIEPVTLSPNDLVENLSKMLRRIIGEDIELELLLAPDLGNVRADPGQIEQVLMNLAVNARDAMPQGGRLTIETSNLLLDEGYADQHVGLDAGSYATITVSDTGCGMDTQTRQRAFEPFFTTKEVGKGTGLGLATVYGIVHQHDGGIWVYSEPGQGSTFKVYLPRVGERAREAEERGDESTCRGNETILLVEDEEMVRDIARQALAKRGYRVLSASHPDEAKRVFDEHEGAIDLLLTDVVMPGKTGPGLHEWLTAKRPSLKVLFMSGYTEHAAVSSDLVGGGAPFLQKPFTPAALAQRVRDVLDG